MDFAAAFAGIADAFSGLAGGPYRCCTVSWPGVPAYDAGGDIVTPAAPVSQSHTVQVDSATEAMRQTPGFVDTDVRLLLPAHGLARDVIVGCSVTAGGDSWTVQSVARDPLGLTWDCRGRSA